DVQNAVFEFTERAQSPYVVRTPVREFFFRDPPQSATPSEQSHTTPVPQQPKVAKDDLSRLQDIVDGGSLSGADRTELSSLIDKIKGRTAKQFRYYGPGDLLPGTGSGDPDKTIYAEHIVFPIDGEAYANSQIFSPGGYRGAEGKDQCDP